MAMRLQRLIFSEANHAHGHVVLAPGRAAQQLFPLGLAAYRHQIEWPVRPFKVVEMFGGCVHGKSDLYLLKPTMLGGCAREPKTVGRRHAA